MILVVLIKKMTAGLTAVIFFDPVFVLSPST
jgi:hypothetical protein